MEGVDRGVLEVLVVVEDGTVLPRLVLDGHLHFALMDGAALVRLLDGDAVLLLLFNTRCCCCCSTQRGTLRTPKHEGLYRLLVCLLACLHAPACVYSPDATPGRDEQQQAS